MGTIHREVGNKGTFTDQVDEIGLTDGSMFIYNYKKLWIDFYQISTGKCVQFKAYLKSFADNFSQNWNKESVYGRNDPLLTFQNTTREITFGWVTAASSLEEAKLNLHHVEHLAAMLYPSYEDDNTSGASSLSAAPLFKVKFANLIMNSDGQLAPFAVDNGLVGGLSGFSMRPDVESGFFDPGPSEVYPKFIELETTLTVVHTHRLGWRGKQWRADGKSGLKKFPYNVEEQTGKYSICEKGQKEQDITTPTLPETVQTSRMRAILDAINHPVKTLTGR